MTDMIRLTKGIMESNTYILWDTDTLNTAIIDAGNSVSSIADVVSSRNLKVKYIILTHVHFDHIYYLDKLRDAYPEALACAHELDAPYLADEFMNASRIFGSGVRYRLPDRTLKEGDTLILGNTTLIIFNTPGHTPGSICVQADNRLFTGDTLFYNGFGRTDLGNGDLNDMRNSIDRLYSMDGKLNVYPGHGTMSSINREKYQNPFTYV